MSDISLNSQQKKAVTHKNAPLLIIAGAGTGKTHVITQRIAWLVKEGLARPEEILALTFTQKAAQEMEERVDVEMPYGYTDMWISTFHSFGDRILRQEAVYMGIDPGYVLMSQAQEYIFFRNHLFELSLERFRPHGNPTKFISALISHFSRLGDELIYPVGYISGVKAQDLDPETKADYLELARVYKEYSELKINNSKVSFYDVIPLLYELFSKKKTILNQYKEKFKYILVDEFQDTNYAQNELIKLLAGKDGNITVVGDDDQAIYKFRGAAISNILDFKKSFPTYSKVVLNKNYRTNQAILDKAYELIKHNDPYRLEVTEKIDKRLLSKYVPTIRPNVAKNFKVKNAIDLIQESQQSSQINLLESLNSDLDADVDAKVEASDKFDTKDDSDGNVKRIHELSDVDEADAIASEIVHLVKDQGYNFSDIAVLVRANNHSEEIVQSFKTQRIPYVFPGPKGLYSRPEIKDLLAFLRIIVDYTDDSSFYRIATLDISPLTPREFIDLQRLGKKIHISVFELVETLIALKIGKKTFLKRKENENISFTDKSITEGDEELAVGQEMDVSSSGSVEDLPKSIEDMILDGFNLFSSVSGKYSIETIRDRFLSRESVIWLKKLYSILDLSINKVYSNGSVGEVLYEIVTQSGYIKNLINHESVINEIKIQNISKFFSIIKAFERESDDSSIFSFLDFINYSIDIGESPVVDPMDVVDGDSVNIMTLHGAKGLEFPVVFIINLVNDRFPTRRRSEELPIPEFLIKELLPEGDEHVQEERRLMYVGMTRAKDFLYMTSADYYAQAKRKKKQSVFLDDLDLIEDSIKLEPQVDPGRLYFKDLHLNLDDIEVPVDIRKSFIDKIKRNISYSHISTYEVCPYQFYFKYFLNIPGKDSFAKSFGMTVHNTMKEFFSLIKSFNEGLPGINKFPSKKELIDIYNRKWITVGYESIDQERKRFKAGKNKLEYFYDELLTKKEHPLLLEYNFRVNLLEYWLRGTVDRIDAFDDGVFIFDYKTGLYKGDFKKTVEDLQLALYAIAIENLLKKKVLGCQLVFIESGKLINVDISDKAKKKALSVFASSVKKICNLDFSPKPGMLCNYCDYKNICDYV
ncbi:UvrD-helicase domain-containing protein [Candidatus Dojkabacteria bacterium]|nr:UvrD-helicase domain-containing protein [Candidatus Dojkabacteria bacterium]